MVQAPVRNVFHLAIPTHDLDETEAFYAGVMKAERARRYNDRVTFNFFEHQVVCHLDKDAVDLDDQSDPFANLYPRHFGMTLLDKAEFDSLFKSIEATQWKWVKPPFERFKTLPERHLTFFVADPSRNLLEFKWYEGANYIY